MPTPSKFTAERRQQILEALSVGASRTTAAHLAGVDEAQVRRWITRGKESEPGTRFHEFYEAVLQAEASPRMRALGIIYREMPDRPDLAWKFIERREQGYAPPQAAMPQAPQPLVIELQLSGGSPLALAAASEVIEGEVIEDAEPQTGADPAA